MKLFSDLIDESPLFVTIYGNGRISLPVKIQAYEMVEDPSGRFIFRKSSKQPARSTRFISPAEVRKRLGIKAHKTKRVILYREGDTYILELPRKVAIT